MTAAGRALVIVALCALSAATAAGQGAHDYRIGAQDVLTVTVFDEPQLSGRYTVETDGTFTFPLIGRVQAGGRTLRAMEEQLTDKLADGYLKKPQVRVEVEQYRSQSVFVIGEVRTPGKYPLTGQMTLIEALAQAGSTTAAASHEVVVIRRDADGTPDAPLLPDEDPDAERITVSIADQQSGRLSQNVALRDGDTVFVPKAETFFVTGHVKTPGSYVIQQGMTVLQALSLAGGLTDRGSNRRIKVIRLVKGRKIELSVELTDPVKPGDTIVVPQRFF